MLTVTDFPGGDYVGALEGTADLQLDETIVMAGDAPAGTTAWANLLARGDDVSTEAVEERMASIDPDDVSDIIFTSGTTGAPKGAMLTHGASVRTYLAWSELVGLREGDRYVVVYPFFHTAGLKSGVLACVLRGAVTYPLAVFDVPTVLNLVNRERITVLPGPPTVFQSILDHPDRHDYDLSTVRTSITGAAVVPVEVIRQMRDVLGIATIITGYGMTETTGTISMCRHDDPPEVIANTVGKPLPGVEVRVVDDDGNDVEPGTSGELIVRGFNVLKGYFDDAVATETAFLDGWLKTGDIGLIDEDGNLHITDRKKDMFIVGGFNAYPAEIEAMLLDHPAITQAAVIGVPDERLGEVGEAFVMAAEGASVEPAEVIEWSRERMANFKVPRRVHVMASLPLTPSGKVMKFELRQAAAEDGPTQA